MAEADPIPATGPEQAILRIDRLRHGYGERPVVRLDHLEIARGEHCLLLGPSGSGKSTLLHLIAGLMRPDGGSIEVDGASVGTMPAAALDRFRGRTIGLVLQRLHLLPALTVAANLRLARWLAGLAPDPEGIAALLRSLGIGHLAGARPRTLSEGEAQRVAIARAVVNRPRLLLADEPTSALDDRNARRVLDLLFQQALAAGTTLVVATHDRRIGDRFARRLELADRAP